MKKIILFIVAAALLILCLPVTSFAAAHAVNAVDIIARLNADGSASVTEVWSIAYFDAEDGFKRVIDSYNGKKDGLTSLQKYTGLADFAVSINGVPAKDGADGKETYSAEYDEANSCYVVNVIYPAEREIVEYTVSYTVNGAVKSGKADGTQRAMFGFEFISRSMGTCNNVTATVKLPNAVSAEDIIIPPTAQTYLREVSDGTVTFSSADSSGSGLVSGTFSAELYAPVSSFDEEVLPSYSSLADTMVNAKTVIFDYVIPGVITVVAAVLIVYFILFAYKRKINKIYKKTKKETDVKKASPVSVPDALTPVQAYGYMTPYPRIAPKHMTKQLPGIFGLAVLECIEAGYITAKNGALKVVEAPDDAPEYRRIVMSFLNYFADRSTADNIIDEHFSEAVRLECERGYDMIVNYMTAFYDSIPKMPRGYLKDANNAAVFVEANKAKIFAAKSSVYKTWADAANAVLADTPVASPDVFAVVNRGSKSFESNGTDSVSAISSAIFYIANVLIKSK